VSTNIITKSSHTGIIYILRNNPKRKGVVAQNAGLVDSEHLKAHFVNTFGRDGLFLEEARSVSII